VVDDQLHSPQRLSTTPPLRSLHRSYPTPRPSTPQATHLITKYQGTGKSFFIGHWEGDWAIRHNYRDPVDPQRAAWFRYSLSEMQRAIDTAKMDNADLVGGMAGVKVWGYGEVNRVSWVGLQCGSVGLCGVQRRSGLYTKSARINSYTTNHFADTTHHPTPPTKHNRSWLQCAIPPTRATSTRCCPM